MNIIGSLAIGHLIAHYYIIDHSNTCNKEAYRQEGREQMADMLSKTLIPDVGKLP